MSNKYDKYNLDTSHDKNMGGFCRLKMASTKWIETFPKPRILDGVVRDSIVVTTGFDWVVAKLDTNSMRFIEKEVRSQAGNFYKQQLTATVMLNTAERNQILQNMSGQQWVLLFKDRQGKEVLIGSKHIGMDFTADYDGGEKPEECQKYQLEWTCESAERAPHYSV